jgi:hypothetical protein
MLQLHKKLLSECASTNGYCGPANRMDGIIAISAYKAACQPWSDNRLRQLEARRRTPPAAIFTMLKEPACRKIQGKDLGYREQKPRTVFATLQEN